MKELRKLIQQSKKLDLAGAIASGITGLVGSGVSLYNNKQNIQAQQQINAQNLAQAKELQEKAWERDDTAYQRAVEDATKAGFSPLAILQAGTTGNTITPTAQATAPQSDLSGIINSLISASGIFQKGQEIETSKEKTKSEIETAKKQLQLQEKQLDQEFTLKNKELDLENKELITQINQLNKSFQLQTNQLNESIKTRDEEKLAKISENSMQVFNKFCEEFGISPKTIRTSDLDEFILLDTKANSNLIKFRKNLPKEIKDLYDAISKGTSKTTSQSGGGGIMAFGTGGSANGSTSTSQAENESYTMTTQVKAKIGELLEKYQVTFVLFEPKPNGKKYNYEPIDNYEE